MKFCLPCILFGAFWQDIHTARISNRLIACGLCVGYFQCFYSYGWLGSFHFLIRFFVPIAMLYLLFFIRVLGAGDIKLFSVICCCIGIHDFLQVFVNSFFVGAFLSLFVLIQNKNIWIRLNYFYYYVNSAIVNKKFSSYDYKSDGKCNIIHFSIAIFAGYLLQRIQSYHIV